MSFQWIRQNFACPKLTMNVPVVYMGRYEVVLRGGGLSITRDIIGGGGDFFLALKGTSLARFFEIFRAPPPKMPEVMDSPPSKPLSTSPI